MSKSPMRVRGRGFHVEFDRDSGSMVGIGHSAHAPGLNFLLGEAACADAPQFGLGQVRLRYRAAGQPRWEACEALRGAAPRLLKSAGRTVGVSVRSERGVPLRVQSQFRLAKDDALHWRVTLQNATDELLELGEVSWPLPFNLLYVAPDQRTMYEERVAVHPFIAGHGSYVLVQALCGRPPFLLLMPEGDTPLEAMAREPHPVLPPTRLLGGGILRVYAYSKASRQTLGWHEWFNGHTSFTLQPGERRTFAFTLRWVDSYADLDETLVRHGVGVLKVIPAPVVPINMTARVAVRSKRAVKSVRCPGSTLRKAGEGKYTLRFKTPGCRTARITFGDGRWTAVHFRAIEPIGDLIRKRASFIARKQQVLDEHDPRHGAFLMWDCEDETLIREARAAYLVGGSDEVGFAAPLFLAAKNAVMPDARELKALARYVQHFLHGTLQRPDDWGVVLWFGDDVWHRYKGSDVCRSFNYPHVFNIYHSLYRAAKRFGPVGGLGPRELLRRAANTAMALYTHHMIAGDAVTIGNMGQSALIDVLDSLDEEGLADGRERLLAQMRRGMRHYRRARYPYGSEFAFDTTGYETVYFFRKRGAERALAGETLDVVLATRHHAPAWYLAGNDTRGGFGNGKFWRLCDEIEFSYMATLNGLVVQDAYEETGDQHLLRSAYASALGVWSLVRDDGAGRYLYTWDPARMLFDPWSSEMGVCLFGALRQQRSYVVEDDDFGLVGYGCEARLVDRGVEVVPLDGVRNHVVWQARGLSVIAEGAAIEHVTFADDGGLAIELRGVTARPVEGQIRVEKLVGRHDVVIDGKRSETVKPVRGVIGIPVVVRPRRPVVVELRPAARR